MLPVKKVCHRTKKQGKSPHINVVTCTLPFAFNNPFMKAGVPV